MGTFKKEKKEMFHNYIVPVLKWWQEKIKSGGWYLLRNVIHIVTRGLSEASLKLQCWLCLYLTCTVKLFCINRVVWTDRAIAWQSEQNKKLWTTNNTSFCKMFFSPIQMGPSQLPSLFLTFRTQPLSTQSLSGWRPVRSTCRRWSSKGPAAVSWLLTFSLTSLAVSME